MKRCVVILIALACLAAKPHQPTSGWTARYSEGVTLTSQVEFAFPAAPGHINYLTMPYTTPLSQAQSVTMTVQIDALSGVPSFDYGIGPNNPCAYPAHVRAYIEQKYKLDAVYAPATYRWWSNPIAIELTPGTFTATTPLTPDQWSDTNGIRGVDDLAGFAAAIGHPQAVGMTFGGGCFFGHGVSVSGGTAQFILKGFTVS